MAKKKLAPLPEPPKESDDQPYGTDANAVHRTNLGPHRVLSARIGYFIQQHQILRSHIEELEDKVVAAETLVAQTKAKKALSKDEANTQTEYDKLKKQHEADMKRYDELITDYDKLEDQYARATEICHENDLDCGDEACETCADARSSAAEAAEEAKIQDGGSRPIGITEQYNAAADERREHDRAR